MNSYRARLEKVIPGGAHTYSRGWDQFPSNAPEILVRGKGSRIFDKDGEKYLDYGMGLRSVMLGYAHSGVNRAAISAIKKGVNLTRPSFIELEAAERIVSIIPSVEMLKFTKNGSTAVTAAIKLARGFTGRRKVLVCKQHPFFSFDDWFIGTTEMNKGVDLSHSDIVKFDYGNIEQLRAALTIEQEGFAAILLEPATDRGPSFGDDTFAASGKNFLTELRALADEFNTLLILDEMITGFRFGFRGAQDRFGVVPDLTTFGKAISNGYPLAFVGGRREIMTQGSINVPGQERLFLLSTTHGPEMVSLAAMLRTLEIMEAEGVFEKIYRFGERLIFGANEIFRSFELGDHVKFYGFPGSPYYSTSLGDGMPSYQLRTLFQQELAKNKIIMPWVALSSAHSAKDLRLTLDAIEKSAPVLSKALHQGTTDGLLVGPSIKPVFRKFN